MQAHVGERHQHAGRFLVTGTRGGYGARAGQRVEQPGRDGTLGPLVTGRDAGRVTDEGAEHDRERGQPGGEGHREPRIDQGQGDDAARRRDDGCHRLDAARGRAPRHRCAANHPADQVSGGEPLGQPEAAGEDVTGQPAPEPPGPGGSAHPGREGAERPAGHDDDDQRDASGQPVAGPVRGSWRRAPRECRAEHDVHGVPRGRRKQGIRDSPGDRCDGQQRGPVRTVPRHPQQQPVSGPVQPPLGGNRHGVAHGSPRMPSGDDAERGRCRPHSAPCLMMRGTACYRQSVTLAVLSQSRTLS